MNKVFFGILFCFVTSILCSQTAVDYSVFVIEKDSSKDKAIVGATVILEEFGFIKESDVNGEVFFQELVEGEYFITIFNEKYNTKTKLISVRSSNIKDTVFLEQRSIELSAVEIADRRKELFATKKLSDVVGTSLYAGKKSEVVVLDLVQGNLASNKSRQVYAQITGLNIYEGSDGGLQLAIGGRGLDPSRTANFNTRQNGYDISADVLGYPENYYTPPTEAISQIQILRGASSLQYGTQFGGLINFKLKEIPSFKKLELESNQTIGSFGFLNTFNRVGVNLSKLSINSYVNYKQGNGFRANSEFNSLNSFFSLKYQFTNAISLRAEMSYFNYLAKQAGGLTDQQFGLDPKLSTRERNWFDVDWKLYNLLYSHELTKRSKLTVSVFHLNASRSSVGFRGNPKVLNENPITALDEQAVDGTYLSPRDLISDDFLNAGAELKVVTEKEILGAKSIFLLGAKYFQSRNVSFQGPGSQGVDANFDSFSDRFTDYPNQSSFTFPNQNLSIFSEQIFYVTDRLLVTPGIRYEYIRTRADGRYNQLFYDLAGNVIDEKLITERKDLPRNFVLMGLGMSYKVSKSTKLNANISQNYRSVTFSDIRVTSPTFIVDENIKDESGFTSDLNLNGRYKKFVSYDVGIFGIYYNDRIGIILDDRANRLRKNIGTAIIAGVESLVDVNIARIIQPDSRDFSFSSFVNSAFTFSQYIDSQESNVVGKRVEFIPIANIKAGLSLGYKDLLISLQQSYISQQFTDVQNSFANGAGESREGIIGEIPSYSVFDFTISYKFKRFKLSSGINNLTNSTYFTRRATGYPGPGIIPSEPRSYFMTLSYLY